MLGYGNKQNYEEKINNVKENIKYIAFKAEKLHFLSIPRRAGGVSDRALRSGLPCVRPHIHLAERSH